MTKSWWCPATLPTGRRSSVRFPKAWPGSGASIRSSTNVVSTATTRSRDTGFGFRVTVPGLAARFWATPKLLKLAEEHGVTKGLSLRVRRIGRRHIQTIKQESGESAALSTRNEWEHPIGGRQPDLDVARDAACAESDVERDLGN